MMLSTALSAVRRSVHLTCRGRAALGTAVLVAGLTPGALHAPAAEASLGACYDDPVAVLSNGVIVDLYATTYDLAADIDQAIFTLHAPAGTRPIAVIYTPGLMGSKEVLKFYGDNAPGTYNITAAVDTATNGINVTASTTVVPLLGLPGTASATGQDHQNLQMMVTV